MTESLEAPRSGAVLSVRTRIAVTVAVLVSLALAGVGLLVQVLESERLEESAQQDVERELDEFQRLQSEGVDPRTGRPFALDALLERFLRRNVPGEDELLVGWVGDAPLHWSPAGEDLVADPGFLAAAEPLVTRGGSTRFATPDGEARITSQPVRQGDRVGALLVVTRLDAQQAALADTMRTYAIVAGLSMLVVAGAAAWQSGRLLRPLRTLRRTADEIGGGDLAGLTHRIPETGHDDITALTRTVNGMLDRLETAFADQRRFLDDAGHELKTPLTILSGHLELLDTARSEEVAETRDLLLDELDRMARLVTDLIVLAKSNRPDFLSPAEVVPAELVQDVVAKARGLGERDWTLDATGPHTPVVADGQRLTQALLALAENAVKHTAPGAEVGLGGDLVDDRLRLWVRDTGGGVAPEDRERIFGRFARAEVPAGDEGFGLGLSIVHAIATSHGGSVDVVPEQPGTCFVIEIPAVVPTVQAPEEAPWPAS